MIVIGVDVHKQSVTAVAVDDAGRMLDEKTIRVGSDELLAWAAGLAEERRWALEDCRRLTRWLERQLLAAGERLVRVPPKLMAPERRAGRGRGKSDAIDALAVARAALREPALSAPRADEGPYRELKLLLEAPKAAAAEFASANVRDVPRMVVEYLVSAGEPRRTHEPLDESIWGPPPSRRAVEQSARLAERSWRVKSRIYSNASSLQNLSRSGPGFRWTTSFKELSPVT
jgi:Transposase